jgi:HK97 family phage prohead protease
MKQEIRFAGGLQAKKSDSPTIGGYCVVFNSPSQDLGGFIEIIDPNAFTENLATKPDIRCRYQHNDMCVLGRTPKTLRVWQDSKGVQFECDINPDAVAQMDVYRSIQRGDIFQMSFGMDGIEDTWANTKNGLVRTIVKANIFECSPVSEAAYTATKVSARALWPDGIPESVALRTKAQRDFDGLGGPVPFARCAAGALRDADFDEEDIVSGMVNWSSEEDEQGERSAKKFNPEKLRLGFAYVANDGSKISDYKLPHHKVVNGQLQHSEAGTRKAVANFMSGEVQIPPQHRADVAKHLRSETALFDSSVTDITTAQNADLAPMGVVLDSRSAIEDARRRLAVAKLKFF